MGATPKTTLMSILNSEASMELGDSGGSEIVGATGDDRPLGGSKSCRMGGKC